MNKYRPTGPYVLQSNNREGKSLEKLMFDDYRFVHWFHQEMIKRKGRGPKTKLHNHLEWLLKRGQTRKPKMLCPQCGERPVSGFLIIHSPGGCILTATGYTCCDNDACQDALDRMASGRNNRFLPFHFDVFLGQFSVRFDHKMISDVFRHVFELPKPLTRQRAFEFFNED